MNKPMTKAALALGLALACGGAHAAKVTLLNVDPEGVGLNDPAPATPVGNNPGTTVGEQRQIAYTFAADLWGAVLKSDVEIKVYASFAPLGCTADGGTLAQAGPNWIVFNFDGAEPDTLYHSALGDSIAGEDLVPDQADPGDISSQFNGNLGQPGCIEGTSWYYGLDGKTPEGQINFLNVVMHELSHGLGFSGFLNKSTGALLAGFPDVYTKRAVDNATGQGFTAAGVTDAQRAEAMRTPGRTVWGGTRVNSQAQLVLDPQLLLRASGGASGAFEYGTASFGPAITAESVAGPLAIANDGAGADTADACETLPSGSLAGKVALVNRGTCGFELKALNAGNAGAIAVVIGNVATSGTPSVAPGMADDPTITATVPTISLNLADANALRAAAGAVTVALGTVPGRLLGLDPFGRTKLYAPTVVAGGSTFSHFDVTLAPNALMEPFNTASLAAQVNVDLTPALFEDEGWGVNRGRAKIGTCTTLVPTLEDGGLIPGANVVANSNRCEAQSAGQGPLGALRYLQCVRTYSREAREEGVLSRRQQASVDLCAATRTLDLLKATKKAR